MRGQEAHGERDAKGQRSSGEGGPRRSNGEWLAQNTPSAHRLMHSSMFSQMISPVM